jgi:hypothetical protein
VDQGRNAEGRFIGSVIREDVGKVECSWKFITAEEWATILKLFKKSAGGKFVNLVTFYDQTAAGWVTKEMYVSDRKAGIWRRDPDTGEVLGWAGPKLSLIEV